MKKFVLVVAVALLTSISMAGIISVNLCDANKAPPRNPMLSGSLAGAPGLRTNNWNNLMARTGITNTGSRNCR